MWNSSAHYRPLTTHHEASMLAPLFAYFGPETFLPLGSILGAIGGTVMIFGRTIVRIVRQYLRSGQREVP
jgi:hypothetical protein